MPLIYDAHTNFAISTVATAPSPATTGTTLTLNTGDGALFPSSSFNAIVWPTGVQPSNTNAEIIDVAYRNGDVLTFTRGPQTNDSGGINRTIVVGDQIQLATTRKLFEIVESMLPGRLVGGSITIPANGSAYVAQSMEIADLAGSPTFTVTALGTAKSAAGANNLTLTMGATGVSVGELVLATIYNTASAGPGISDSGTNLWSFVSRTMASGSTSIGLYFVVATGAIAASTGTINLVGGGGNTLQMDVFKVSSTWGWPKTSAVSSAPISSTFNGTATSPYTGSITPVQIPQLVVNSFGASTALTGVAAGTGAISPNGVVDNTSAGGGTSFATYQITTSLSTISPSVSWTSGTASVALIDVGFKPSFAPTALEIGLGAALEIG